VVWTTERTGRVAQYMQDVLEEFVGKFVAVYFDDIIVYSDDEQSHIQHVKQFYKES
jgi:hypothetical protein